jgi:diguanylate cyclase (GGDEF)-like protein
MKQWFSNFKYQIIFLFVAGLFVVSLITAVATLAMREKILFEANMEAERILKIFQSDLRTLKEHAKLLSLIDYTQDDVKIVQDYDRFAHILKEHLPISNAIGLIKILSKEELDTLEQWLATHYQKNIQIEPIVKINTYDTKTPKQDFYAVIVYRYPTKMEKNAIGVEVASSFLRYQALVKLQESQKAQLTAPAKILNDDLGHRYSTLYYAPMGKEWVAFMPFTFQKLIDSYKNNNPFFKHLHLYLKDIEFGKQIACYCGDETDINHQTIKIKNETISFGGRSYEFDIRLGYIYTLANFWQPFVGFISGLGFLLFMLYYLYFKEMKNQQIEKLHYKLLEAELISLLGHFTWFVNTQKFICSDIITKMFQLSSNEFTFDQIATKIHPNDVELITHTMERITKEPNPTEDTLEFRTVIDGKVDWFVATYTTYHERNRSTRAFGTLQNITERKNNEIKLKSESDYFKELALTDALTKAYNKNYFNDRLSTMINLAFRYNNTFSLILFDIDHFKKINDTYGHIKGDHVLKTLASLVASNLRTSDILCRWGGEEFAIIFPHTDIVNTINAAEKLRTIIANTQMIQNHPVTCSFGVTELQAQDTNESILHRADEALYKAKQTGRNRVVSI